MFIQKNVMFFRDNIRIIALSHKYKDSMEGINELNKLIKYLIELNKNYLLNELNSGQSQLGI